jgi:hypothetical protein
MLIGGIEETQEMLTTREVRHRLRRRDHPDSEDQRGARAEARSDVKYPFSIDLASFKR